QFSPCRSFTEQKNASTIQRRAVPNNTVSLQPEIQCRDWQAQFPTLKKGKKPVTRKRQQVSSFYRLTPENYLLLTNFFCFLQKSGCGYKIEP
ncbi:MAG: hypothetical protein LBK58_11870, partial [Prevotellaceae bacterium]|nr:hypothetical protein [Prevotellaceae bacterium]